MNRVAIIEPGTRREAVYLAFKAGGRIAGIKKGTELCVTPTTLRVWVEGFERTIKKERRALSDQGEVVARVPGPARTHRVRIVDELEVPNVARPKTVTRVIVPPAGAKDYAALRKKYGSKPPVDKVVKGANVRSPYTGWSVGKVTEVGLAVSEVHVKDGKESRTLFVPNTSIFPE